MPDNRLSRTTYDPKHTRGPWWADSGACGTRTGLMSEEGAIALLGLSKALNIHNVNLITAAPDMHEALSGVADALLVEGWHPSLVDEHDWNPNAHVEITLTITDARLVFAALTKAEGKEPDTTADLPDESFGADDKVCDRHNVTFSADKADTLCQRDERHNERGTEAEFPTRTGGDNATTH